MAEKHLSPACTRPYETSVIGVDYERNVPLSPEMSATVQRYLSEQKIPEDDIKRVMANEPPLHPATRQALSRAQGFDNRTEAAMNTPLDTLANKQVALNALENIDPVIKVTPGLNLLYAFNTATLRTEISGFVSSLSEVMLKQNLDPSRASEKALHGEIRARVQCKSEKSR